MRSTLAAWRDSLSPLCKGVRMAGQITPKWKCKQRSSRDSPAEAVPGCSWRAYSEARDGSRAAVEGLAGPARSTACPPCAVRLRGRRPRRCRVVVMSGAFGTDAFQPRTTAGTRLHDRSTVGSKISHRRHRHAKMAANQHFVAGDDLFDVTRVVRQSANRPGCGGKEIVGTGSSCSLRRNLSAAGSNLRDLPATAAEVRFARLRSSMFDLQDLRRGASLRRVPGTSRFGGAGSRVVSCAATATGRLNRQTAPDS